MKKIILFCALVVIALDAIVANPCHQLPKVHPKKCCDFPMPIPEALLMSCMGEFGAQSLRVMESVLKGGPPRGACVAECIGNATGLISETEINMELLLGGFKMLTDSQPEWHPVIEKTLPECGDKVKALAPEFEKASKLPPLDTADPICSAAPGFMLACSIKGLYLGCPDKYYKSTPECNELKNYAETCPLGF